MKTARRRGKSECKLSYSFIKILTGSDLSRRRLPFMSIAHREPGPCVWLSACMHGDEVGGIVVIQELFRQLKHSLLRGTVNAFPLMNPIGFETMSRSITVSREDLNRSFPGDPHGSLGERIAHTIFSKILGSTPDVLLDLHNDWRQSMPYVVLDRKTREMSREVHERSRILCKQSGFCIVEDAVDIHSSLSHNMLLRGIPSVTYELGESAVVNEKIVAFGVRSIVNLLARFDMLEAPGESFVYPAPAEFGKGRVLRYSDQPTCTTSGIIRFLVKPGDVVAAQQPVARVFNAFGKQLETIHALKAAIVLGYADSSAVFPGMHVMAFGEI